MTKEFKKLYSPRKDGKHQVWHIELDGDQYRVITGQWEHGQGIISSSIVPSAWKQAIPTNVGRSNERDGEAQALFEIAALYKSRSEQGAVENIGDPAPRPDQIKPMLAQKYDADKDIEFPLYSQPKLDGGRCLATEAGLYSRTWKPIISAPHIHEDLQPLLELGYKFDGELYNHELKHDFEKIMSLIRKSKPTEEELAESKQKVQYWIYDLIMDDVPFADRMEILKSLDLPDSCVLVETTEVNSFDELDEKYSEYDADGYEGQMIRKNVPYEFTRSKALKKRKDKIFFEDEFEVLKIVEGTGNWAGTAKVAHCRDKEGTEFKATLKGTYEAGQVILAEADEYIGGEATVIFQEKTNKNEVPRFPVVKMLYKGKRDI